MDQQKRIRIILITGPTGSGKTETAIGLAKEFNGEIISADSMQIYRFMDIGTAKPTKEQQEAVKHHLIDVVNPDESFNAAIFMNLAAEAIVELELKKKVIFLVGGAGLYIKALLGGLFQGPGADENIRNFYRMELKKHGKGYLYEKLKEKDQKAAAAIDKNDIARIIRALEVIEQCGDSIVNKQSNHKFGENRYDCLKIGIFMERDRLYERIDQRVEAMIMKGFIEEVQCLLAKGYNDSLKPMQSLGYKHIVNYIKGSYTLDEAIRIMKRDTRHYSKRQMTWFGADKGINWISITDKDTIKRKIETFLYF